MGGRHRPGTPLERVSRRAWDRRERAAAERMDRLEPGWVVWYGVGSRRFHAAATWPAPEPPQVAGRTVDELRHLMREAESAGHRPDPPVPVAGPPVPAGGSSARSPLAAARSIQGAEMTGTPEGLRAAVWELPYDLAAVGPARRAVTATLRGWGLAGLADDVVLVAGELLANAVAHGGPPVRVSLWATATELCLRVTDHGPGVPHRLDAGPDAVHGRGLPIVAALAPESGVLPRPDVPGKTVWARWPLSERSAPISSSA
ncbi:hypothetical protein Sru01_52150 [Sphaerisporangium rufum]|uniref:Histidine kinase/HSP90-like ATPase domain-containing protein n=1 Tax=Sphaerisporangium rufum TaxID=1381558 RepID=A0A919V3M2_9ACTN|nr:ATP-binding protein [Sphaerisporangium rufum]GII80233.1 hypothetical protein Sru01_52150 [Sphaerisporangium rufum]